MRFTLVTAISSALYLAISLTIYFCFGTGQDLTIFTQALDQFLKTGQPNTFLKEPGFSIFGDHFSPIILLLSPIMAIFPSPQTLLVCQAVSLGISVGIVDVTGRRYGYTHFPALAYGLSVGPLAASAFDFHEVALGAPILALTGFFYLKHRYNSVVITGFALLLVKEDMGLVVAALGIALLTKKHFIHAAILIGASISWTVACISMIIPHFNPYGKYPYRHPKPLEDGIRDTLSSLTSSLFFPGFATLTLVIIFLSFSVRVWRSPFILTGIIPWFARSSVDNFRYWVPFYHYPLLLCVAFAIAAIEAKSATPVSSKAKRAVILYGILMLLVGPHMWTIIQLEPSKMTLAQNAIDQVPPGTSVAADSSLTSHLVKKCQVAMLRPPKLVNGNGKPLAVDYLLLDLQTRSFSGPEWIPEFQVEIIKNDYHETWRNERFVLYRHR